MITLILQIIDALPLYTITCVFACVQVEILCGKDRGKQGRIVSVARSMNRVFVGGLNTVS